MLTMKDWTEIEKAYEDVIAEVRREKEMKWPRMSEYGEVDGDGNVTLPFAQIWEDFVPLPGYRHVLGGGI